MKNQELYVLFLSICIINVQYKNNNYTPADTNSQIRNCPSLLNITKVFLEPLCELHKNQVL